MADNKDDIGLKLDQGKRQWYAMPLNIIALLADVFAAGERKYAVFNCLNPFDDGDRRFWDATMRHMEASQLDPLAIDPETGCYHGIQAAWNLIMRVYHAEKKSKEVGDEENSSLRSTNDDNSDMLTIAYMNGRLQGQADRLGEK